MKKRFFKWIAIFTGIVGLLILGYFVFIMSIFGIFDKYYTNEELIENYNLYSKQIHELKNYFQSIVPENTRIEIEFEDSNELFRFGAYRTNSKGQIISPIFLEWDLKIGSVELDSLMQKIKWTSKTLDTLKFKFNKANCIQIDSNNPFQIGFRRSGLGMYSYFIFKNPLSDSLKNEYQNDFSFKFIKDSVAWKYDGGAID